MFLAINRQIVNLAKMHAKLKSRGIGEIRNGSSPSVCFGGKLSRSSTPEKSLFSKNARNLKNYLVQGDVRR